jgi:SAM-dependent methyltransferase
MNMASPFTTATPSFAEMYERELVGPLFRPWAELLIERVAPVSGEHVLDVACGTGILARLARERVGAAGRVVGVDLSPIMLGVAKQVGPGIEWREGNAVSLPLAEGEIFDVVLCHQGLQFFPDRAAAAREMRRALAPNGRLAIGVWRGDDESPFLLGLRRVAESHLGPIEDVRHSFPDPEALRQLLDEAGFREVRVERRVLALRFAQGETFARLNANALVGMTAAGKAMGEDQRAAIVAAIVKDSARLVAEESGPDGLVYEISSNVATGRG